MSYYFLNVKWEFDRVVVRTKEMIHKCTLSVDGPIHISNLGWSLGRVKAEKWTKIYICSEIDTNLLRDLGYLELSFLTHKSDGR